MVVFPFCFLTFVAVPHECFGCSMRLELISQKGARSKSSRNENNGMVAKEVEVVGPGLSSASAL